MIYTKQQILSSSLVGADTNLSVLGALNVEVDAMTEMMQKLHLDGVTIKREYNAFWVFTKNRIKFLRPLAWSDVYTVESFISSISTAKLILDAAIKNAAGELVAYCSCEMCALDLETGRIRRVTTVGVDETVVAEQPQIPVSFAQVEDVTTPAFGAVTVAFTNIDFSHHTNNIEYVRFILNTYSVSELLERPIKEIEICYVRQSYEGDTLTIHKSVQDDRETFAIKKDGNTVVKCEIIR